MNTASGGFQTGYCKGVLVGRNFLFFYIYFHDLRGLLYINFFCNIVINFNSTISDVFLISCFQCLSHTVSYIINTKNNLLLSTFMHLTGTFNPSDLHYTQAKLFFFFLMDN